MISPWCTHGIPRRAQHPPMCSWYPRCTEHPPMYSFYPPDVLNTPRCTHDIPQCNEHPRCTERPPMYWTHIIQGDNRFVFVSWSWHLPSSGNQAAKGWCCLRLWVLTNEISIIFPERSDCWESKDASNPSGLQIVCKSFLSFKPGFHFQQTSQPGYQKKRLCGSAVILPTNRFVLTQNWSLSWSKLALWKLGFIICQNEGHPVP